MDIFYTQTNPAVREAFASFLKENGKCQANALKRVTTVAGKEWIDLQLELAFLTSKPKPAWISLNLAFVNPMTVLIVIIQL